MCLVVVVFVLVVVIVVSVRLVVFLCVGVCCVDDGLMPMKKSCKVFEHVGTRNPNN